MQAITTFWRDLTLKPQGITIVVAAFLPIIAIVAMGPAVPTMIEHFANDPEARAKVPAMIGAPGLAMAILAPFTGMLVDKIGRRPILLIATLFYAIFGAAPLLLNDLDQIYTSRLLLGISEAGILTVVNTLIGDYWDDKGRKNWLFLQGLLGPFIAAIFSLIVGYASQVQWNGVFFVYLVALPIFVAMLLFLFEPKRADASAAEAVTAPATAFPWVSALTVAAVTLFASMLYYVFIINGALVFKEMGVTEPVRYAELIFIPSLFILLGAAIFRLLAMRANLLQLGVFMALLGIGLSGMGLATSVAMMVASLVIQQTAAGMTVPTLIAWTQSKFGFEHRGRAMGIWTGAFFLGQSQSPRLVHAIDASQGSMQGAFLTMGIIGLAGAVIALGLLASKRTA